MTSASETQPPICFVAMPITTSPQQAETYGDPEHWSHVSAALFAPAIKAAEFHAVFPFAQGSDIIHSNIVSRLATADMVLCDLSSANPNVFFEFGIRTALNLPVALVAENGATLPFDTGIVNTFHYDPALLAWEIEGQVDALAEHMRLAVASCAGKNPLWEKFGLTIQARTAAPGDGSPNDARFSLIFDQLASIKDILWQERNVSPHGSAVSPGANTRSFLEDLAAPPALRLLHAIDTSGLRGVLGMDVEGDKWLRVYLVGPSESVQKRINDLASGMGAAASFTYGEPSRYRASGARG